jgi:hypothetical protein
MLPVSMSYLMGMFVFCLFLFLFLGSILPGITGTNVVQPMPQGNDGHQPHPSCMLHNNFLFVDMDDVQGGWVQQGGRAADFHT